MAQKTGKNKGGRPCCPNHGEPLDGIGFPIPKKGTGICPVSGAEFAFEAETDEETMTRDKLGNMQKGKQWSVAGDEITN